MDIKSDEQTNFIINLYAVIACDGKILIKKSSTEFEFEIPVINLNNTYSEFNENEFLQNVLAEDIKRSIGLEIKKNTVLLATNMFRDERIGNCLDLVFFCEVMGNMEAKPSVEVSWINSFDLQKYDLNPKMKSYIAKGFSFLPYVPVRKKKTEKF